MDIIREVSRVLAGHLDGLRERYAQDQLTSLLETLQASPNEQLYNQVLETALDAVHGAERGAILVRETPNDKFTFRATAGYRLAELSELRLSEEQVLTWYAPATGTWGEAEPRIQHASTTNFAHTAVLAGLKPSIDRQGKPQAMKASLIIPIREDDWVRAVLNLDSAVRENAFALDSIRIAHQVAMTASMIFRAAHDRAALQATAMTDSVTNLLNRRGLELELDRALRRSKHTGEQLSLLMLDMANFKTVNDTLGHAKGDEALRLVAQALQSNTRNGDVIARWGGDEFVAILPGQGASDAQQTARRLTRAINSTRINNLRLAIDIGAATYPTDATMSEDLLRVADARMYQHKKANP